MSLAGSTGANPCVMLASGVMLMALAIGLSTPTPGPPPYFLTRAIERVTRLCHPGWTTLVLPDTMTRLVTRTRSGVARPTTHNHDAALCLAAVRRATSVVARSGDRPNNPVPNKATSDFICRDGGDARCPRPGMSTHARWHRF
ncbi:hypothetical protein CAUPRSCDRAFT_10818 [Caulochytrium protostelioides]|uniref:Uncharacterized protein n=1 Tax=Caulochytrium protostelioides TaxID=1555241 RepID=A0A4P9X173_9FUNG|nr:hypothetical protein CAUPRSCDRAFT_10818 [Caulochytrium protostelioides]